MPKDYREIFPAIVRERIDDHDLDYPLYVWEELSSDGQGDYADFEESLFARHGEEARELNDTRIDIPDEGIIVWMRLRGSNAGIDTYEFSATGGGVGLWVVTNVCPIFEDESGSPSSTPSSSPSSSDENGSYVLYEGNIDGGDDG